MALAVEKEFKLCQVFVCCSTILLTDHITKKSCDIITVISGF